MKNQKSKDKIEFPGWIHEALKALKPPENITVTEWADKHRILDARTSAEPGNWSTDRTPYLRGIMDAFCDPEVEDITFLKPTQVGGTEALFNILGYIACQDQAPTMVIYPTLDLAEYTSKNRIQPMVKLSKELFERYKEAESKILELQFDGMPLVLSGANSPASLSSRPIKYLLIDEMDKFPKFAGKEASPMALAKERQRTFAGKKTMKASTPTTRHGGIYKSWERADSQYEYFVSCPHCGFSQTFKFKRLKWPKDATPNEALNSTYYECENCKGHIQDYHKQHMLNTGEWKATKNQGNRNIAFRLNALYSPWIRFGDAAYEFLNSKNAPELLMNFINSWLAEVWEDVNTRMDTKLVIERQDIYEEGIVPDEALILTGGVDVQKDHFYWTIRAWSTHMTSWNIGHGICETWDNVEDIMNKTFCSSNGQQYQVNLCAVDSGNDTESVYDFIAKNSEWAVPIKGSSRKLTQRYKISPIDKVSSKANGMMLYILDTGQYKDMIAGRLRRQNGKGSWMVFQGCDEEYADQICSEEKILEKTGDQESWIWKPKASNIPNHYLDCEVYAALAADLMNVRYLTDEDRIKPVAEQPKQTTESSFIQTNGQWLDNAKNWRTNGQ